MRATGLFAAALVYSLVAASGRAEEPMDLTPPGTASSGAPVNPNPAAPKPAKPKKAPVKAVKPASPPAPATPAPAATAAPAAATTATGARTPTPQPPGLGALTQPASGAGAPPATLPSGLDFGVADPALDIAPPPGGPQPDLAYGAFQRGLYLTAFQIAIEREARATSPPRLRSA